MLTAVVGDLTEARDVQYVCNAANGVGVMGAGVAGAIRRAAGYSVQEEAVRVCKESDPDPGSLYVTSAGRLPYAGVVHSVTVKYPRGPGVYYVVRSFLESSVSSCSEDSVTSVASSASGTGVGRSSEDAVARASVEEPYPVPHAVSEVVDLDEDSVEYVDYYESGAKESSSDGSGP